MNDRGGSKVISFPGAPHAGMALQFRIDLLLMPEPVWRRLLVPANFSFWDLHVAIQDTMGWLDRHPHRFVLDDPDSGRRLRLGVPDALAEATAEDVLPGWEFLLGGFFRADCGPALYTYDFRDDWQHELMLEEVLHGADPATLPACLDGSGLCPEEECGGPAAWTRLLAGRARGATFDCRQVCFENPRDRWQRNFGHD